MGKVTFVVEFEDGKEPAVNGQTEILGGRLSSILWADYRDDFFTDSQVDRVRSAFDDTALNDADADMQTEIINKMELMVL